jgi:hypothetical protein
MKNRLTIAILVACMLPLGATTTDSKGAEQRGSFGVSLRIGNPGAAPVKAGGYDLSVRHALFDHGTPRDLALAAIAPGSSAEPIGPLDDQMFRAASLAPDDALVQWLAANRLLAAHDEARAAIAIETLIRLEPYNASVWALALSLAVARHDDAATDDALAHMAKSTRADEHIADALHAWLAAYEGHPRPLSAFANPAEAGAAPFVDAMAKASAAALPSYRPFLDACSTENTHRHDVCATAARVMLYHASSLASRRLGFTLLRTLGADNVTDEDRAARRELAWISANASRVSGFADLDPLAIAAHREDWRTLGDEYEIMQRAMHRAGLPAEAPLGWVPSEGDAIARAGAG